MAAARNVGKQRDDMSVEGVNLNNLKDAPRQLSLTTRARFSPLPGISLGGVKDISKQQAG